MAEQDALRDERRSLSQARLIGAALDTAAVLIAVVALGWALERGFAASRLDHPTSIDLLVPLTLFVAGLVGGLSLWALGEVVRRLEELAAGWGARSADDAGRAEPATTTATAGESANLAAAIREMCEISLLNEQQRAQRLAFLAQEALRRLEQEVPALLRDHDWLTARKRVGEARTRFPSLPQWDALLKRIEEVRAGLEVREVDAASRQVSDLLALGAWPRAAEIVADLLARHPESIAAQDLARRVTRERDQAEAEQRRALMARAQDAANRREWAAALEQATAVIRRFPQSAEAESLRAQLPLLQENVEIQSRQRIEAEIRELVREHRYEEAVRIAEDLIDRFPASPQAAALREQLPRLREKLAETFGSI